MDGTTEVGSDGGEEVKKLIYFRLWCDVCGAVEVGTKKHIGKKCFRCKKRGIGTMQIKSPQKSELPLKTRR